MKVKELIEELKKYPADNDVKVKSYDKEFNNISVEDNKNGVILYIRYIDKYGNYIR